jgi:cytochrome c-type biogenesis protein CcmH
MLWVVMAVLTAGALAFVLRPLLRRAATVSRRAEYDIAVYRDQLGEVERDRERGVLSADEVAAANTEIERRILAAADAEEGSAGEKGAPRDRRPAAALAAFVALVVPAAAVSLYLNVGSPGLPDQPLAERRAQAGASEGGGSAGTMEQMAARLAQRLIANPDDLNGWKLLGRSYMEIQRYAEAADAYRRVLEIGGERLDVSADYAEALVFAADAVVTPEALDIFTALAEADRLNPRARYYLGLAQAQKGDIRGALQAWVDLRAISPPVAPWLAAVDRQIASAARDLGIDATEVAPSPAAGELAKSVPSARPPARPADAPGPTRDDMEAAAEMSAAERADMIRAMVERLAGRLEKEPGDVEGWRRLARAYEVLGEKEKAAEARRRADAPKRSD